MKIDTTFLQIAALLGILAVGLGAFGAHGLKALIPAERITTFETGVRYHYYHTFALMFVALLRMHFSSKFLRYAGWLFLAGIICFSGSLYLLACRDVLGIENYRWLGPITPIGGVFFIFAWGMIFFGVRKK